MSLHKKKHLLEVLGLFQRSAGVRLCLMNHADFSHNTLLSGFFHVILNSFRVSSLQLIWCDDDNSTPDFTEVVDVSGF